MTLAAYRLQPRPPGGFHLGREGLDQETSAETFPSDSLFAALVATWIGRDGVQVVTDALDGWLGVQQPDDVPFRLASLFPYVGDLPLFPMPRLRVDIGGLERPGLAKSLKKIAYVSPAILRRLLSESAMVDWLPGNDADSDGLLLQDGKIWITRDESVHLPAAWQEADAEKRAAFRAWHSGTVPRVTVDRQSNDSTIYQVGRTTFADGCGLWLLCDIRDGQDQLEDLLHVLGDQGIGGERSAGYGTFSVERMPVPDLPPVARAARVMTLSRYNPTATEWEAGVLGLDASYEIIDVGGWLASPEGPAQRRKRVRMIEAGSVLSAPVVPLGRIVDVAPDYAQPGAPPHPVYRSGIALTIGVPGKEIR